MSQCGGSHFQPGDGPRRGLLCSVIVQLQTSRRFVSSSAADCTVHYRGVTAPVLQDVPSEANPKVRNHGEGPY